MALVSCLLIVFLLFVLVADGVFQQQILTILTAATPPHTKVCLGWKKVEIHEGLSRRGHFMVCKTVLLLCLLIVSGDIEVNPGPIKYPCSVCEKSVKSNQQALSCDSCDRWTHCKCSGVTTVRYYDYQLQDYFQWVCPRCLLNELPYKDCSVISNFSSHSARDFANGSSSCSLSASYPLEPARSLTPTTFLFNDLKSPSIHIAHLNVRSLLPIIDDVHSLIVSEKIDILALSETWLDDTITDSEICLDNYYIVRKDRNRRGGGVAFFVSNHLRCKPCYDLCISNIESVWIELFPGSKRSMLLCCTYKSPSTSNIEYYDNLLSECDNSLLLNHQNLTILGDLNSDLMDPALPQTKLLSNFCKQLNLTHLVTQPTRITEKSSSLLDVIITNKESCFRDTVVCPFSGSDHHIIATHLVARGIKHRKPHNYVKHRTYRNLTEEMVTSILDIDIWESVLSINDVSIA